MYVCMYVWVRYSLFDFGYLFFLPQSDIFPGALFPLLSTHAHAHSCCCCKLVAGRLLHQSLLWSKNYSILKTNKSEEIKMGFILLTLFFMVVIFRILQDSIKWISEMVGIAIDQYCVILCVISQGKSEVPYYRPPS